MNRRLPCRTPAGIALALACLAPMSCGGSGDSDLHPVHGEVFFNGKPASGAAVHFHPVDEEEGSPAYATVQDDGSFRLSTRGTFDGAEAGDYRVTISWPKEERIEGELVYGPDQLGDRYRNPETSNLKFTVVAGENEVPRFDLKVE